MHPIEYAITGHPGVTIKLCEKWSDDKPAYWYCIKPMEREDPRHCGCDNPSCDVDYLTTEGWRDYGPIQFPTAEEAYLGFLEFMHAEVVKKLKE